MSNIRSFESAQKKVVILELMMALFCALQTRMQRKTPHEEAIHEVF